MSTAKKFPKLSAPGHIGSVRIKNRIIRAGSNQGFPPDYDDGYLQPYYSDFYEAMARGGVGMVTIGASPLGVPPGKGYRLDDDKYIPSLREFTDRMHQHGCPVFIQTFHLGPWLPGELSAAASTIPEPEMPITTQSLPDAHSLSIDEIQSIVREFGRRIERAKRAGFDGVEINAGCTHLFSTFMSRLWNRRTDQYGFATLENRSRFVVEVVQEIRKRCGKDFAIVVLYNPIEPGIKDGITAEEGIEFAKLFEAAGVDAIIPRVEYYVHHLFDGKNDSSHFPDVILYPQSPDSVDASGMNHSRFGANGWVPLQVAIKKAVNVPVVAVGRIDPDTAETLLANGDIDFISMTRNLIADHDYPNKIFRGEFEDVAPCTACMTCFDLGERALPVNCRVNAAAFKTAKYDIVPAAAPKKVVVVGGGAAGMEAARVAALRGHRVTLVEKEKILGGAMNPYAVVMGECKEDVMSMVTYLKTQITKLGVEILMETEADKGLIEKMQPDVVIVAVGGSHIVPEVPGMDKSNVLTSQQFHAGLRDYLLASGGKLMADLDRNFVPVGNSVAIIGGDYQGTQIAEFLIKRGCKVSLVESGPEIGINLLKHLVRPQVYDWLYRHKVPMFTHANVQHVTDSGVVITTEDGTEQTIEADTILLALPFESNTELYHRLEGVAPEVYNIGDGANPAKIVDAIADGSRIGREI